MPVMQQYGGEHGLCMCNRIGASLYVWLLTVVSGIGGFLFG
jgi:hypothetical protein